MWRTDGTEAGTYLLADINPGSGSSYPTYLSSINGAIYFAATDGVTGTELWKSDGTRDGTYLLKDINPGAGSGSPMSFTKVYGKFFFTADDGINGTELWRSDGTESSTVLVKDIRAGSNGSYPYYLINLNGMLVFTADDNIAGSELWKSDGTTSGTVMVSDIRSGAGGSGPGDLVLLGSYVYFGAMDGTKGVELWRTNGTTVQMVADMIAGANGVWPRSLIVAGGKIFFKGNYTAGTLLSIYNPATAANDAACIAANGPKFIKSTTAGGCIGYLESPSYLEQTGLTAIGSKAIFQASDQVHGVEPWISDGTATGTGVVKDINTAADGTPTGTVSIGSRTYFVAPDGNYLSPAPAYYFDATNESVMTLMDDIITGSGNQWVQRATIFNGTWVFHNYPYHLVAYDPTINAADDAACVAAKGTGIKKAKNGGGCFGTLGSFNDITNDFIQVGNRLYFTATTNANGSEIWSTDGTVGGTVMVHDSVVGTGTVNPYFLTPFNGAIYFWANWSEFWKYDPRAPVAPATCASTHGAGFIASTGLPGCVGKISNGLASNMTVFKEKMYYTVYNATYGTELWVTDGTSAGTMIVHDLNPGSNSANPSSLFVFKDRLYFRANDGVHGPEIWMYDARPSTSDSECISRLGAGAIKAVNTGGCIALMVDLFVDAPEWDVDHWGFTVLGDRFAFIGGFTWEQDEVWISDGTAAGTHLLRDIYPGTKSSEPRDLKVIGDKLTFTATDPVHGKELWISDGTTNGTRMIKEIFPGPYGSSFNNFVISNNQLFFNANSPASGVELWRLVIPE